MWHYGYILHIQCYGSICLSSNLRILQPNIYENNMFVSTYKRYIITINKYGISLQPDAFDLLLYAMYDINPCVSLTVLLSLLVEAILYIQTLMHIITNTFHIPTIYTISYNQICLGPSACYDSQDLSNVGMISVTTNTMASRLGPQPTPFGNKLQCSFKQSIFHLLLQQLCVDRWWCTQLTCQWLQVRASPILVC